MGIKQRPGQSIFRKPDCPRLLNLLPGQLQCKLNLPRSCVRQRKYAGSLTYLSGRVHDGAVVVRRRENWAD